MTEQTAYIGSQNAQYYDDDRYYAVYTATGAYVEGGVDYTYLNIDPTAASGWHVYADTGTPFSTFNEGDRIEITNCEDEENNGFLEIKTVVDGGAGLLFWTDPWESVASANADDEAVCVRVLYESTGVKMGSFKGDKFIGGTFVGIGNFTSLTVDNLTLNNDSITSDTGKVSFGDDNLESTGVATLGGVTVPTFSVAGFVKNAANGVFSGGNAVTGSDISLVTTGFGGILSASDNTAQKAFDTIDDHSHTGYLKADGTVALTADWDAGGYEIRALTFESDVATGTAPLTIASTTAVSNLNADLLDGNHAAAFAASTHAHSAADITSGTLATARGGTNQTSWAAGTFVYASAADTLASYTGLTVASMVITNSGTYGQPGFVAHDTLEGNYNYHTYFTAKVGTDANRYVDLHMWNGYDNSSTITLLGIPRAYLAELNAGSSTNGLVIRTSNSTKNVYFGNGTVLGMTLSNGALTIAGDLLVDGTDIGKTGNSSMIQLGTNEVIINNQDLAINTDNKKLLIGAGDDLQLYHDGTNSYIYNKTGELTVYCGNAPDATNGRTLTVIAGNGSGVGVAGGTLYLKCGATDSAGSGDVYLQGYVSGDYKNAIFFDGSEGLTQVGYSGGKIGLYGTSGTTKAAHITSVSTGDLSGGDQLDQPAVEAQFSAIATAINSIITALENIGITATS